MIAFKVSVRKFQVVAWMLLVGLWCVEGMAADYYYYRGEKYHLESDPNYVMVEYPAGVSKALAEGPMLQRLGVAKMATVEEFSRPKRNTYLYQVDDADASAVAGLLKQPVAAGPGAKTYPVYRNPATGLFVFFFDEIAVRLRPDADEAEARKYFASLGVQVRQQAMYAPEVWLLKAPNHAGTEILDLANELELDKARFVWGTPNLYPELKLYYVPDDPYYREQWHLNNTGQRGGAPGADISAEKAWDIAPGGLGSVRVAVVDTGMEDDHEDLAANVAPGVGWDFVNDDPDSNPDSDQERHATAVAGIIAAVDNDKGVVGVAYKVSIFCCKIFGPQYAGDFAAANAIRHAGNNAQVMNNSWGGGPPDTLTEDAIIEARLQGCVILFASGNDGADMVSYPSAYPWVMSIGASSKRDVREGYSNFGPGLSFVAPSAAWTTDLMGEDGYNEGGDDNNLGGKDGHYATNFNGTSAATPVAAGIAALLVSQNARLTHGQVATLMAQTTEKVGGALTNYQDLGQADYTDGTATAVTSASYDQHMGYGRLNANWALRTLEIIDASDGAEQVDDALEGLTGNNDPASAALAPQGTFKHLVAADEDWFSVPMAAETKGLFNIRYLSESLDLSLELYDSSGTVLLGSSTWGWNYESLEFDVPEGDDASTIVLLRVFSSTGAYNAEDYQLSVQLLPLPKACQQFAPPVQVGATEYPELMGDVAGMVASAKNPGVFWVMNGYDSQGNMHAINESGKLLASYNILGPASTSWYDIATAVDYFTGGQCLYAAGYSYYYMLDPMYPGLPYYIVTYTVAVHCMEEPVVDKDQDFVNGHLNIKYVKHLRYPVETGFKTPGALIVDSTNNFFLVEYSYPYFGDFFSPVSEVYYAQGPPYFYSELPDLLVYINDLPFTGVDGGDLDPSGTRMMVKNDEEAFFWDIGNFGYGGVLTAFQRDVPCAFPLVEEQQMGGIALDIYGSGFYTMSRPSYQYDPIDGYVYAPAPIWYYGGPTVLLGAHLEPVPAYTTDDIHCVLELHPANADELSTAFNFTWVINGAGQWGLPPEQSTLPSTMTVKHDMVYCMVTLIDEYGQYNSLNTETLEISNTSPTITTALISPSATATEADVLTASGAGFADIDGDPEGYHYQWLRDGAPILGARSQSITSEYFRKGQNISCNVTGWDGEAEGPAVETASVLIVNAPPSFNTARVWPEPAFEHSVLRVIAEGWTDVDGDLEGYKYRWIINGALAPGEVNPTLDPYLFNAGDVVACEVTPWDGEDSGMAHATPGIYIQPVNHAIGGASYWTQVTAAAPWSTRRGHSAVAFGSAMYLMGGLEGALETGPRKSDVWRSKDGADWSLITSTAPWGPRSHHTSLVFNGEIWIIGGSNAEHSYLNDVWRSADGVTWTRATSAALWSKRRSHTSVVHDGKMWIIGGYGESGVRNDVWYSENGADWWRATSAAPWAPRSEHSTVSYNGKLWVIGGSSGDDFGTFGELTYDVWTSPDGVYWRRVMWSVAGAAVTGQASVVYENRMWTLGGLDAYPQPTMHAWSSTDGLNWTLSRPQAAFPRRAYHAAVVFDDLIWVLGGGDNQVWRSQPADELPELFTVGGQLPPATDGFGAKISFISDDGNLLGDAWGGTAADQGTIYFFDRVPEGWSGTLVPSKPGHYFRPPALRVENVESDIGGLSFTAIPEGRGAAKYGCFVDRQYGDFLNRGADAEGREFYLRLLCTGVATPEMVVRNFIASPEFADNNGFIARLYFGLNNNNMTTHFSSPNYRIADEPTMRANSDQMRLDVSNGQTQREAQLGTIRRFIDPVNATWNLVTGGVEPDNYTFVEMMYTHILGRATAQTDFIFNLANLDNGAITREELALNFITSDEAVARYRNHTYVAMCYLALLNRTAEKQGFDFHTSRLEFGVADPVSVLGDFIYSPEYLNRLSAGYGCAGWDTPEF